MDRPDIAAKECIRLRRTGRNSSSPQAQELKFNKWMKKAGLVSINRPDDGLVGGPVKSDVKIDRRSDSFADQNS